MKADDLVSALTRRGLNASYEDSAEGVETVRIRGSEYAYPAGEYAMNPTRRTLITAIQAAIVLAICVIGPVALLAAAH